MTIRILSLLALLATFASTPAFAADEEIATPTNDSVDAAVPAPFPCQPWMRNCVRPVPPPMRYFQCFARNALGRTFVAYGNFRTPRFVVENRAVQNCRFGSLPLIRFTCRPIGCR